MELIEDALGGFNVANCNETCNQNCESADSTANKLGEMTIDDTNNDGDGNRVSLIADKKKYAFDVVDDLSGVTQSKIQHFDSNDVDKFDNTTDDSAHKRIVRVSIQKPDNRDYDACFRGNDSYALYDIHKITKSTERHQIDVNVRFKTLSPGGLLLLIYHEHLSNTENIFSLSIEDG